MVRYVLLRKRLGMIPTIFLVPDATASAWNWPRRGHLRPMTIFQLWRPAKPDPVVPFVDQCLPLLPLPLNRNRHSQPAPWSTPSQFSEDSLISEGEDQGRKTPPQPVTAGSCTLGCRLDPVIPAPKSASS